MPIPPALRAAGPARARESPPHSARRRCPARSRCGVRKQNSIRHDALSCRPPQRQQVEKAPARNVVRRHYASYGRSRRLGRNTRSPTCLLLERWNCALPRVDRLRPSLPVSTLRRGHAEALCRESRWSPDACSRWTGRSCRRYPAGDFRAPYVTATRPISSERHRSADRMPGGSRLAAMLVLTRGIDGLRRGFEA